MGGMGKTSKDKSARDRQRTQEGTDRLWSKRTSDEDVMGMWNQMQATQMGQALPILDALMQAGVSQSNANPYGPKQEPIDFLGLVQQAMGGGGQSPGIINQQPQPGQPSPSPQTGGPVNTNYGADGVHSGWQDFYLPPMPGSQPQQGQLPPQFGHGIKPRGQHTFGGIK